MTKPFKDSKAKRGGVHRTNERTIIRSSFGSVRFEYLASEFYLTLSGGYRVHVSRRNMAKLAGWINMMMGESEVSTK